MLNNNLKKAVIPAAGLGTRMYPAAKMIKKELFPIITPDGICQCLLQRILEEIIDAGIQEILLIIKPSDLPLFQKFFAPLSAEIASHLSEQSLNECKKLEKMGERVHFVFQTEQLGFGHAIYTAKDWCNKEPFLLVLSDHIYKSNNSLSCAKQLINSWQEYPDSSMASFYPVSKDNVKHYGTASGDWLDSKKSVFRLNQFVEKPTPEFAAENLRMDSVPKNHFLCVYGQYILSAEIFAILQKQIKQNQKIHGEFQLTTAMNELVQKNKFLGYCVKGQHYDIGQPLNYLKSIAQFGQIV
ncbi:MAG: sugar phosphate nucleotidyltransferase [Lentisphaeria bacterium]